MYHWKQLQTIMQILSLPLLLEFSFAVSYHAVLDVSDHHYHHEMGFHSVRFHSFHPDYNNYIDSP